MRFAQSTTSKIDIFMVTYYDSRMTKVLYDNYWISLKLNINSKSFGGSRR
jgi:hypothetical protein